eukprot:1246755-Alexandrium_andersonii.AAC.1
MFWPGLSRGSCPHCDCPMHGHYSQCMFWNWLPDVAKSKYIGWVTDLLQRNIDVRWAHSRSLHDPGSMPPAIVRQMGNNMEDVQRVLNTWRRSQGEALPDFKGPWWMQGSMPSESQISEIRNELSMPPLTDP